MPKKVPLVSIGVQRDGRTIYPEVGKSFDFTDAEIRDLKKLSETTKVDYFRNTVNEESDTPVPKKSGKAAPAGDGEGDQKL